MSRLVIAIGDDLTRCRAADHEFLVPTGAATLASREIAGDPPRPEELTNAIGFVTDHLDDLVRERPDIVGLPVVLIGPEAEAIAAVEAGHTPTLPMRLERDVVEEVFRTLATEATPDRARNPGLAPELVGTVVAGCCIAVAVMRRLHLAEITIEAGTADA
jgi:exopolyphosphatase/pppGpp-phosphohydrolase